LGDLAQAPVVVACLALISSIVCYVTSVVAPCARPFVSVLTSLASRVVYLFVSLLDLLSRLSKLSLYPSLEACIDAHTSIAVVVVPSLVPVVYDLVELAKIIGVVAHILAVFTHLLAILADLCRRSWPSRGGDYNSRWCRVRVVFRCTPYKGETDDSC
jgi:hypothetical protein